MKTLVFFGTPDFAIPSLYALHKSRHKILAVVTIPDKPAGRGLKERSSPIKQAAEDFDYPIHQPSDLNDPDFLSIINNISADLFVVVAYRILPEKLISIPSEGAINTHASLLPKYRGAAPINHALLNGENETGVTTFKIQKKVDAGDILLQKHFKLNKNITAGEVYENLAKLGAELIVATLDQINNNKVFPIQQNHLIASSAPKISSDDCLINWNNSSERIHNQIRAFSPQPGAYTFFQNKRVKLFNSKIKLNDLPPVLYPGEIHYKNFCIYVGTGSGIIYISEIQLEGKKRLPVSQFIRGFPKITGNYFE